MSMALQRMFMTFVSVQTTRRPSTLLMQATQLTAMFTGLYPSIRRLAMGRMEPRLQLTEYTLAMVSTFTIQGE